MPRRLVPRDVQNRVKAGQSTDHDDVSRYARITVPILPGPTISRCCERCMQMGLCTCLHCTSDSEDTRLAGFFLYSGLNSLSKRLGFSNNIDDPGYVQVGVIIASRQRTSPLCEMITEHRPFSFSVSSQQVKCWLGTQQVCAFHLSSQLQ